MNIIINTDELEALCGLPHIQQLAYLRGIRPYMDSKTGITGIKRRISYQSIAEQLYIEPHPGIKSKSYSRDQMRRAVAGLARAGLIHIKSDGMQLILQCQIATGHYSIQNKAAINPPQQTTIKPRALSPIIADLQANERKKVGIAEVPKAATPLNQSNNLYLLARFEKFWALYPEKKSRERAVSAFKQINPDNALLQIMLNALTQQIEIRNTRQAHGEWLPPWKYPANWLAQQCWKDEIKLDVIKEKRNAKRRRNTTTPAHDPFWSQAQDEDATSIDFTTGAASESEAISASEAEAISASEADDDFSAEPNIISLQSFRREQQAHR